MSRRLDRRRMPDWQPSRPENWEGQVDASSEPRVESPRIDDTSDVQPRAEEAVDDTAIARSIRMEFEKQSDLETDGLVVDVVRGVAYLHGDLKADSSFDEIVDLASSVPGVRRVQSLLHLPESEIRKPSTPTAGRR